MSEKRKLNVSIDQETYRRIRMIAAERDSRIAPTVDYLVALGYETHRLAEEADKAEAAKGNAAQ
jgi:hypothetical protein